MNGITKMMTLPVVAAAMAFAACSDSYPGLVYTPDNAVINNEDFGGGGDSIPMLVFLNDQDFFSVSATRGTGAYDDTLELKRHNSTFYVFAFRDQSASAQGATVGYPVLTKTAYSPTHETAGDRENSSCLLDGPDYNFGMPFRVSESGEGELLLKAQTTGSEDSTIYYSATYQDAGYNFFAYHIDDFVPTDATTHRTESSISYDLTIDGSQDIMLGCADSLKKEMFEGDGKYANLNLKESDVKKITDIGFYSTYAGHRNVHPTIDMHHALTRIFFTAYPGDTTCTKVRINKISLVSKAHGTLTVAARTQDGIGLTFNDTPREELFLCKESVDGITPCQPIDTVRVEWKDEYNSIKDPYSRGDGLRIGSSLMVAPDTEYEMHIYYDYDNDNGYTISHMAKYPLKMDGKMFEPGYFYNIKIAIYGLQEIVLGFIVDEYKYGGEILIDPDNENF